MTSAERYAALKSDAAAYRFLLWEITARTPEGLTVIGRFGEEGWTTEANEALPNVRFYRSVMTGLNLSASLRAGDLFGGVGTPTYAIIEVFNYDGRWDAWATYSVDELTCRCLMVGFLSDGTKVTYTDALTEPVMIGVGIDTPSVGDTMKIYVRSRLGLLERDAQPLTFSEPCPVWPGDGAEFINLGDRYDLAAGSYTFEGWLWAIDNFSPAQTLVSKDTGASGYGLAFGAGGVLQWIHKEQANSTTATAALIKNQRWTHWAVRFDAALSQRQILLDATVVATTAGVTGNHVNNAASFLLGSGAFGGKQSRVAIWNTARTDAELRDNMYQLFAGAETGLVANLVLNDGVGRSITDRMATPIVIPNALSTGMTWGSAAWIGQSLAGQSRKRILGRVRDVEIVPRDPAKLIYEAGIGPLAEMGTVSSNANALSAPSIVSRDLARGLVTLTPGTAVGKLTEDLTGSLPWGSCLYFDGVDDSATAAKTCPAGSMWISILVRPETTLTNVICAAYRSGTTAGLRALFLSAVSTNRATFQIRSDDGTSFQVDRAAQLLDNEFSVLTGVVDTTALEMRLYVNGLRSATLALTGTFNTVLPTLYIGRRDDAVNFFKGWLDQPAVGNRALTDGEVQILALRQLQAADVSAYGVVSAWPLSEGSGTSPANLVAGQPALVFGGAPSWAPSRAATIDLVLQLLGECGITTADLDTGAACAYLDAVPGDAGWVVSGGTYLQTVNELLLGTGAALIEGGALFKIDLFRPTTGTPVKTFTEANITASPPLDGANFGKTVWGIDVAHSRFWAEPFAKETVAGIIVSQPDRYSFVTETWRFEPARDASVLDAVPGARILTVYSPLQRERDAVRLGATLLPAYAGLQNGLALSLDTEAGLALGAEVAVLIEEEDGTIRFGGITYWRIVEMRKEDTDYGLVLRRVL